MYSMWSQLLNGFCVFSGHSVQRYSVDRDVEVYRIVSHLQMAIVRSVKPLLLLPYLRSYSLLTRMTELIIPVPINRTKFPLLLMQLFLRAERDWEDLLKL